MVVAEHDDYIARCRVRRRDEVLRKQDQVVRDALRVLVQQVVVIGAVRIPVAGALLVREAGGSITDFDGAALDLGSRRMLASNGLIHEEMCAVLRELVSS